MNLVGKIFVGIIALMSVVCLTLSVVSYASHHNWKEESAKLDEQILRAVDVAYENNKLIVTLQKQTYIKANDELSAFALQELALKKTGLNTGLVCPSGYVLKQTYYYSVA
jgi:hypothetical protein